jgi:hypothetical protein
MDSNNGTSLVGRKFGKINFTEYVQRMITKIKITVTLTTMMMIISYVTE